MDQNYHIPVMLSETIEYLNLAKGKLIVDATVGTGGHASVILERITPGGKLIAIDRDQESLFMANSRLQVFGDSCKFVHANFMDIESVLADLGIKKVDGIIFDLGISTFQLENP
ncbi:MAG: 16S rRNA (cytosine(1402)-N(4))-methyltransferase, partial [Candidatus Omnitrophota bacterium]